MRNPAVPRNIPAEADPFDVAALRPERNLWVKGRSPRGSYDADFAEVYVATNSLPWPSVLRLAATEIDAFRRAQLRATVDSGAPDETQLRSILLRPVPSRKAVIGSRTIVGTPKSTELQLANSHPAEMAYTIGRIDVNVKLRVEDICTTAGLPERTTRHAVESAQLIYAALLKADNHALARIITANESNFISERIVDVLFGPLSEKFAQAHARRAERLNSAARLVAESSPTADLERLLVASVVSGGVIAAIAREGELGLDGATQNLRLHYAAALDSRLGKGQNVSHTEFRSFVDRLAAGRARVGWFFDDNGETVLDLRFLNAVLDQTPVELTLFVNSLPVSENTNYGQLVALVHDGSYPLLSAALRDGRARIVVESMHLAAFERAWLSPRTLHELDRTDYVLFKGANLYETFQDEGLDAYYAFVVASPNSLRLTSRDLWAPILVHSPPDHTCF